MTPRLRETASITAVVAGGSMALTRVAAVVALSRALVAPARPVA